MTKFILNRSRRRLPILKKKLRVYNKCVRNSKIVIYIDRIASNALNVIEILFISSTKRVLNNEIIIF